MPDDKGYGLRAVALRLGGACGPLPTEGGWT